VLTVLSIVIRHLVPDVLGDVMNFRRRFGENLSLLSRPNDVVYIYHLYSRGGISRVQTGEEPGISKQPPASLLSSMRPLDLTKEWRILAPSLGAGMYV
jgi:hypothetical protein